MNAQPSPALAGITGIARRVATASHSFLCSVPRVVFVQGSGVSSQYARFH